MKKIVGFITTISCIALVWYLFIQPFEFKVNFSVKTLPGDVIQSLRIWDKTLPNANILSVDSVDQLIQKVTIEGRSYQYNWNFELADDSTTKVSILISQPGRSVVNKLLIPFTRQPIEEDAAQFSQTFYRVLKEHLAITRVQVLGERQTPPSFCVCRTLSTLQSEKAHGMMKDYDILTSFVSTYNLKADGPPIIRVNRWSHSLDSLNFDFCFPVKKNGMLPPSASVSYKEFASTKALKAVFYGNYITSDRAWYELIKAADKDGYKVVGLPIEYFHHNPSLGLNEKEWKAEVFLPVE